MAANRIEDNLARMALRRSGGSAAKICHEYGIPVSSRITFMMLRDTLDFPARPMVTDEGLGTPSEIFHGFHKSATWVAWKSIFETAGIPAGGRVLLVQDHVKGWGSVAIVDRKQEHLGTHLKIKVPDGPNLQVVPYHAWLDEIGWAKQDDGEGSED